VAQVHIIADTESLGEAGVKILEQIGACPQDQCRVMIQMITDPRGIARFNFKMPYLLAGIHFIPTILGFFAVSEIFVQAEKKARGS